MNEQQSFWQKLRAKYRVAVINEDTLGERLHMRLSLWNLIIVFTILFLLTLLIFALVIWYTPLKSYLPGFNEDLREELVTENARVDSLLTAINVQNEYLSSIKRVIAGEVEPDSVRSLDSIYVMRQAELLAAKSQIEEDFVEYYESKGKDQLSLFDMAIPQTEMQPLFRPVTGVITTHFQDNGQTEIRIQTPDKEKVMATLNGTVASCTYNINEAWTVVIQHDGGFMSIYSGMSRPTVVTGSRVEGGDIIGSVEGEHTLGFGIWRDGIAMDPETVIAF